MCSCSGLVARESSALVTCPAVPSPACGMSSENLSSMPCRRSESMGRPYMHRDSFRQPCDNCALIQTKCSTICGGKVSQPSRGPSAVAVPRVNHPPSARAVLRETSPQAPAGAPAKIRKQKWPPQTKRGMMPTPPHRPMPPRHLSTFSLSELIPAATCVTLAMIASRSPGSSLAPNF